MKFRKTILTGGMLVLLCASLSAQDGRRASENIPELGIQTSDSQKFRIGENDYSISDILKFIIENNDRAKILIYDAAMADSDSKSFNAKYMPVLFAEGSYNVVNYPADSQKGAMSGEGYTEKTAKAGIQKSFSTGTTVKAGVQQKYYNNEKLGSAYGDPEYYNNGYFVQVEQELLKNLFGYQDSKQRDILKNSETIKNDIAVYNMSMISLDAVVSVWNYALAYSTYSNMKLKLDETRRVRAIIRSNVNLGVNEGYYLNYWNALVSSNEIQFANTENTLRQKERDVVIKYNITPDNTEITSAIDGKSPITAVLTNQAPSIDAEEALKNAYENRADYRQAVLSVENAKNNVKILDNESLPSLKAGVSMSSMGQRDESSDAYGDAFSNTDVNYGASISLTYPLYNAKLKTDKRNAEMQLEQAKLAAENTRKNVYNDVMNGIDVINTAYEAYVKARQTRIESERYYVGFRRQLSSGKFSAAEVKNALDMMIDSRSGELQALVYYNMALLQFDITQNRLFKANGIDIEKIIKAKNR